LLVCFLLMLWWCLCCVIFSLFVYVYVLMSKKVLNDLVTQVPERIEEVVVG